MIILCSGKTATHKNDYIMEEYLTISNPFEHRNYMEKLRLSDH